MYRKKGKFAAATAAGLVALAISSAAQAMTIQQLQRQCSARSPWAQAFCVGFVQAVRDTMDLRISYRKIRACVPRKLSAQAVKTASFRLIQTDPYYRSRAFGAAPAVAHALARLHPCRR